MKTELESGWFAIKMEADDKDDYGRKQLTKVSLDNAYVLGQYVAITTALGISSENIGHKERCKTSNGGPNSKN